MFEHRVETRAGGPAITDAVQTSAGLLLAASRGGLWFRTRDTWHRISLENVRQLVLADDEQSLLAVGEPTGRFRVRSRVVQLVSWARGRPSVHPLADVTVHKWATTFDGRHWCVMDHGDIQLLTLDRGRLTAGEKRPVPWVVSIERAGQDLLVRGAGEGAGRYMICSAQDLSVRSEGEITAPPIAFPKEILGASAVPPVVRHPVFVLERISDRSVISLAGPDRRWEIPLAGSRVGLAASGLYAAIMLAVRRDLAVLAVRTEDGKPLAGIKFPASTSGTVRIHGSLLIAGDEGGRVIVVDLNGPELLYEGVPLGLAT